MRLGMPTSTFTLLNLSRELISSPLSPRRGCCSFCLDRRAERRDLGTGRRDLAAHAEDPFGHVLDLVVVPADAAAGRTVAADGVAAGGCLPRRDRARAAIVLGDDEALDHVVGVADLHLGRVRSDRR